MDVVIELNNFGVWYVEKREFDQAIIVFKKAMSLLRGCIEGYIRSKKRRRISRDAPFGFPISPIQAFFEQQQQQQTSAQQQQTNIPKVVWNKLKRAGRNDELPSSLGSNDDLFVFQCPLRMSTVFENNNDDYCFFWPTSYTEMSIILTFNLALAHHLQGNSTSQDSDKQMRDHSLRGALDLYAMALDLLLQDRTFRHSTTTFTAAIVNNMGVIHETLGNRPIARQCIECVLSVIMVELAADRKAELKEHLDGFFFNINAVVNPTNSAAAA